MDRRNQLLPRRLALIIFLIFTTAAAPAQSDESATVPQPAPAEKISLAIIALMNNYEPARGLWQTEGWWNAANTVTVLGEAASLDPAAQLNDTLRNTFIKAQKHSSKFRNDFYDDEGWWALAWIQAFDVTHRQEYLDMAVSIFANMSGGWDDTCGGGIWWKKDRMYKNAIANELFLSVGARLAMHTTGTARAAYLAWATREWNWFHQSGMINAENLVNDGLTPDCKNNGRNTWTYNQGVILGGLTQLSQLNGDPAPRQQAGLIAKAAIVTLADANGILHDKTEPNCSEDTVQFKGIFVRNLAVLQAAAPDASYVKFLHANADAVWNEARTSDNHFACTWSGPARDDGAAATTSALDALTAAALVSQVK